MLLHKSDTGQRKNPHFTAIGCDIYSAHYCKESHTVFSLLKLQQTPLFLFLLLFPCNSGAAITCAFTRYWWWDEGQYAAGGSIPSPAICSITGSGLWNLRIPQVIWGQMTWAKARWKTVLQQVFHCNTGWYLLFFSLKNSFPHHKGPQAPWYNRSTSSVPALLPLPNFPLNSSPCQSKSFRQLFILKSHFSKERESGTAAHTLSAVLANEMLNSGRRALETAGTGLREEEEKQPW